MRALRIIKNLWKDDRGQTTTEYILILAVVVMIAMKFKGMLSKQLESTVEKLGGQINDITSQ